MDTHQNLGHKYEIYGGDVQPLQLHFIQMIDGSLLKIIKKKNIFRSSQSETSQGIKSPEVRMVCSQFRDLFLLSV
jgi:hypothetical protein